MQTLEQLAHAGHMALHLPFIQGGIAGLAVAAAVDLQAFRSWKSWDDIHRYDWNVASFRWAQGFAIGALGAIGLKALI